MAGKTSKSNVISDVTQTLQKFDLLELQQYTREQSYSNTASKDFHLFYVGRDDVHDILKYVLSRASVSLYLHSARRGHNLARISSLVRRAEGVFRDAE